MTVSAAELATIVNGTLEGDGSVILAGAAGLEEAREGELSFCKDSKHNKTVAQTKASAVILPLSWKEGSPCAATIKVEDPDAAFMKAAAVFAPKPPVRAPGIHPSAIIDPSVKIGKNVHIGPYTVIEKGASIGNDVVIDAQVWIGADTSIGDGSIIYPQVTLREGTVIGKRVILHCGVRLGCDGYGYTTKIDGANVQIDKIPQLGIVEIEDDVEIGANTTIDRARVGRTRIGRSTKIDNLVQIGHNVQVGQCSGLIAQSGVAGSAHIGNGVLIWAQAGISGHIHVHDRAQVGPQAGVPHDVESGAYVIGTPAMGMRELAEITIAPKMVKKLSQQIKTLKAEIAELKNK